MYKETGTPGTVAPILYQRITVKVFLGLDGYLFFLMHSRIKAINARIRINWLLSISITPSLGHNLPHRCHGYPCTMIIA